MVPSSLARGSVRQLSWGSRMSDRPVVLVSNMTALPWRMTAMCMGDTPEFSLTMVHSPTGPSPVAAATWTVSSAALLSGPDGGTLVSPVAVAGAAPFSSCSVCTGAACSSEPSKAFWK
jgi:hypothetical protein